jgi:hypothetical protein
MRISIKPGRSRFLAIAGSVLLSGAAVAAATVPAQASPGAPALTATNTVTVTPSVTAATTPYDVPFKVPVDVTETDATAQLTVTVSEAPALPAADTLTIAPTTTPTPAADTTVDVTGTLPTAYTGVVTVSATDGTTLGTDTGTFNLTAKNTVTVTLIGNQTDVIGTTIKPLQVVAADSDTVTPPTANNALTYTATGLAAAGLAINADTGLITGEPTKDGAFPVTVTATDGTGATDTVDFTVTVGPAEKIAVTAPAKTQVYTGVAVDIKPSATDTAGKPALTWTQSGLPPGLGINKTTGAITGRPSKAGKYNAVKLTATDTTTKAAGTLTVAIVVSYPFDILNLDPKNNTTTAGEGVYVGFGYSVVLKGIKVTSLSAKNLPAGMGFQAKPAMLYGWPVKAGTYSVVINGAGTSGATSTTTFKLVVKAAPNSGATGQVHLALGGKCLLDPGNHTANGTHVEISNCVSGSTEKWTVATDATLRVNGRCLDIAGTGGYSGRVAELWSCNGSAREQWTQGTDGELVNPASGVCLTDPGSATRNGTTTQTGSCRARSSEQWTLPAHPILAAIGGSCADDLYSADTEVDMFWCNGTGGQTWIFEPNGTIRPSQYPNSCVTLSKSKIVLKGCASPTSEQKWSVSRTGGFGSEIALGGVCMATPSLTTANGTQLVSAKCTASNPNVHWHIW